MEKILLWFILTNGSGYIAPQEVLPADMICRQPGPVIGVLFDRPTNPRAVLWPDPVEVDMHCEVDISQRVAGLAHGDYHLATTIIAKTRNFGSPNDKPERYIGHDPHTSEHWQRSLTAPGMPGGPSNFRVRKQ
jgi:hypothetical protein